MIKYCRLCKHREIEFVASFCGLPEPEYRCKAKNRDISFISLPRPFCKLFEPKSESSETYSKAIDTLKDVACDIGSDMESVSKIFQSMASSAYENARLDRMRTEYIDKIMLSTVEDQLEPCPACGCKPRVQVTKSYTFDIGERTRYDVGCPNRCGQIFSSLNLESLIESWNRYAGTAVSKTSIKPKSTNCPNCGAPVDIHAEKCAYCDTPYI